MKNKTIITITLAALLACTAFTGCGKTESTTETEQNVAVSQTVETDKTENSEASSEETVKTLSEALSENDYSIWYTYMESIDTNNSPRVFVFYKDGTYVECKCDGKHLGDYEQMTDTEIVSLVEETIKSNSNSNMQYSLNNEYVNKAMELGYSHYGNYYVTNDKQMLQDGLKETFRTYADLYVNNAYTEIHEGTFMFNWMQEHPEQAQQLINDGTEPDWDEITNAYLAEASTVCDPVFAEMKTSQEGTAPSIKKGLYTLSVWTDKYDTENKVTKEVISFSDNIGQSITLDGYMFAQPIGDSYYGGYVKDGRQVFVTRTSKDTVFEYDAVGTEGISVNEIINLSGTSEAVSGE